MPQTTINVNNASKPAPKWFRKLEMGVCMILIPAAISILQAFGLDGQQSTRIQLFLSVGIVALFKFFGIMLANGEEYAENKQTSEP